jgi:hypothetical protein
MFTHEIEMIGTVLFACAVLHTFLAAPLTKLSHRFPERSAAAIVFHWLGEVELVFAFWALILMVLLSLWQGPGLVFRYQESLSFAEPIFVFSIMMISSSRPVLTAIRNGIQKVGSTVAKLFRVSEQQADFLVVLVLGPLSGSLITEPAAMTVTAILLSSMIQNPSKRLIYFLLGTLFVNVSIGGALTPFAAPPILMVAGKWGWGFGSIFQLLGWKSALVVLINSLIFVFWKSTEILKCQSLKHHSSQEVQVPLWLTGVHFLFLFLSVAVAHHPVAVVAVFLAFFALTRMTASHQSRLRAKESLFVAVFLGGIVMFGAFQKWWLGPMLESMNAETLYLAATLITSVTDNAALTFLGSQVEGLSDLAKYYLVAGALAGGGLTIIANAPNAAGYGVLQRFFPDGLNPIFLLRGALLPTLIAFSILAIS